jgi:N6-L-threonylcarbamoyladenine synthase
MRVLGIETSCDETSAAVLDGSGNDVVQRSLVILSQDVHRIFGGVVPEIASRAHLTAIVPVVEQALADADMSRGDVDAVAVTNAPGLVGALLVGVSFAKAYAFALGVPVIGVHHMEGHLFATALEHRNAVPPFTALLVSGGHTMIVDVEQWGRYRLLGRTRDDAAGEAFDKVAKLLGLPYPGGPHIERLASRRGGDGPSPDGARQEDRFRFARPMLRRDQTPDSSDYYDVSFSGLKTAVLNAVKRADLDTDRAAIARAFQDALIGTLVEKTARAAEQFGRDRVVLGGGVAGNATLVQAMRERLTDRCVFAPSVRLATDNAAMIARAGLYHLENGERSGLELNAFAGRPIPGLVPA